MYNIVTACEQLRTISSERQLRKVRPYFSYLIQLFDTISRKVSSLLILFDKLYCHVKVHFDVEETLTYPVCVFIPLPKMTFDISYSTDQ
jgi:hypothetical protein